MTLMSDLLALADEWDAVPMAPGSNKDQMRAQLRDLIDRHAGRAHRSEVGDATAHICADLRELEHTSAKYHKRWDERAELVVPWEAVRAIVDKHSGDQP
jgi:hypothetical protein